MNVSRRWSASIRAEISVRTAIHDSSPRDSNGLTAKSTGKLVPSRRRASPVPWSAALGGGIADSAGRTGRSVGSRPRRSRGCAAPGPLA